MHWERHSTERIEHDLANIGFGAVAANLLVVLGAFLTLCWAGHAAFGIVWHQPVLATVATVILVPNLPVWPRVLAWLSLWVSRCMLIMLLFITQMAFAGTSNIAWNTDSPWPFLILMTVLGLPLMWYCLWQPRQFGMLASLGAAPAWLLPPVYVVTGLQVYLWLFAITAWFNGPLLPPLAGHTGGWLWGLGATVTAVIVNTTINLLLALTVAMTRRTIAREVGAGA